MRLALAIALVCLEGCATIGASSVPEVQHDYNSRLAELSSTQLLLNLVRLRYRDPPAFLDIASVTTQQTMSSDASLGVELPTPLVTPRIGGSLSVTPTVTYAPLQGEDFVRRLMQPVSLSTATLLASSGWSISRVLHLAVDRLNDARNAPRAAGPTPLTPPVFSQFSVVANALQELQYADLITLSTVTVGEQRQSQLLFTEPGGQQTDAEKVVRRELGLTDLSHRIQLTEDFSTRDSGPIRIRLRSVMGAMFYLSQAIEVPLEHEARGLVTVTRTADKQKFDWQQLMNGMFRVHSSAHEPEATVRVHYRDTWFFIADDDLESKSTLFLLLQLFQLQAGRAPMPAPVLTIPAGGN